MYLFLHLATSVGQVTAGGLALTLRGRLWRQLSSKSQEGEQEAFHARRVKTKGG